MLKNAALAVGAISFAAVGTLAPVFKPGKPCEQCGGPAHAVAASLNTGSTNSAEVGKPDTILGGSYQIFHHQSAVSTTLASS